MKFESNPSDVSTVIKVSMVHEDYAKDLEAQLKDYRKRASIPGFREGKVPMSVVNKMYGKALLLDVINKRLSEGLFGYIREQELDMLGEPMPTKNFPSIDIDNQKDFEFSFDIALSPDLSEMFKLSKKDKVTVYNIAVTEEEINARIENYKAQFGEQVSVNIASEEKDLLKVNIKELEGKVVKDGGIQVEEVLIAIDKIVDKSIQKKVIGIEVGASILFNPNKAYKNDTEVASMLKVELSEVELIKDVDFEFTVVDIIHFNEAEINQDLFDKVFGTNAVTSEEEFKGRISDEIKSQYLMETDYKFMNAAKVMMEKKLEDLKLADDILKRWILSTNEKVTESEIESHYPQMTSDLKWQLIKNKIIKDYSLNLSPEEELAYAKKVAKLQFMQYGMMGVPAEMMDNYAVRMLQDDDQHAKIQSGAIEDKVLSTVRGLVKLDEKEITHENFLKLLENEDDDQVKVKKNKSSTKVSKEKKEDQDTKDQTK